MSTDTHYAELSKTAENKSKQKYIVCIGATFVSYCNERTGTVECFAWHSGYYHDLARYDKATAMRIAKEFGGYYLPLGDSKALGDN